MRTAKFSTKQVLGVVLAGALAIGATLAVASNSQAVATPKATATPLTGSAVGGASLTVTGTGFKTGATKNVVVGGTSPAIKGVVFAPATTGAVCTVTGTTAPTGTSATTVSTLSATKIVVKTPALTAGAYLLCVYDNVTTSGTWTLIGAGSYTTYAAPTVTDVSPAAGTVAGGSTITITGTGFTSKATITIGGTAATAKFVSATSMTAKVPSHVAGNVRVVVKTEAGSSAASVIDSANLDSSGTALLKDEFEYLNAISLIGTVTSAVGDGSTLDLTGVGFDELDFTGTASVDFYQGATNVDSCDNPVVVDDTEIVCDVPLALANGAYIVVVTDGTGSTGFNTVISSSSVYTVAPF